MKPLVDVLREIIGLANFYIDGSLDYSAVLEYFVASVVLCIVVSSVFRFLCKWVGR